MLNHDYQLQDLSMTGLAVIGANDNAIDVGMSTPITLRYGQRTLFEGKGRVVRHQPGNSGTVLGIHLEGDYLNIAALREQHRRHLISYALGPNREKNWQLVPAEFRQRCAEVLDLLRSCRPLLEEREALDATEESALLTMVETELTGPWLEICHELDLILEHHSDNSEVVTALKKFTERVVTPEFMGGPVWERGYRKPLGYPGDYGVMDYIYSDADAGDTLYGRLLHRLGRAALKCVATRKDMMSAMLTAHLQQTISSEPLKIMSIGCGSSQEIREALQKPISRPAKFTLIDQDDRALNVSFERLYPETLRHAGMVQIQCLQTGFQRLVNPRSIKPAIEPQDILYSMGIMDYLRERRALRFCRTLYSLVRPGGTLVVANVEDPYKNWRWRADCIADWPLLCRTHDDMAAIGEDLGGEYKVQEDPTRNVLMLSVRKPL